MRVLCLRLFQRVYEAVEIAAERQRAGEIPDLPGDRAAVLVETEPLTLGLAVGGRSSSSARAMARSTTCRMEDELFEVGENRLIGQLHAHIQAVRAHGAAA